MLGWILQALTIISSLGISYLFGKKGHERWGYLFSFLTLPLWVFLEWYYHEWLYLMMNPIYFYFWGKALKTHWSEKGALE